MIVRSSEIVCITILAPRASNKGGWASLGGIAFTGKISTRNPVIWRIATLENTAIRCIKHCNYQPGCKATESDQIVCYHAVIFTITNVPTLIRGDAARPIFLDIEVLYCPIEDLPVPIRAAR